MSFQHFYPTKQSSKCLQAEPSFWLWPVRLVGQVGWVCRILKTVQRCWSWPRGAVLCILVFTCTTSSCMWLLWLSACMFPISFCSLHGHNELLPMPPCHWNLGLGFGLLIYSIYPNLSRLDMRKGVKKGTCMKGTPRRETSFIATYIKLLTWDTARVKFLKTAKSTVCMGRPGCKPTCNRLFRG